MALIKQGDVETKLGRDLTQSEQHAFATINNALQTHVEHIIGSAVTSANETTRYYDGGLKHIAIDPCTAVSAVKYVDADNVVLQTVDTSYYTTEPVNRTLKRLLRHRTGRFQAGANNIAVTAVFSIYDDSDTLNVVKHALLESLVSELDNSDNIKRESIEGYSIEYASSVTKNNLQQLRLLFPEVM